MQLNHLRLLTFRAHNATEVDFAPGINFIFGSNGAGKTNLLEAIHYLCLTKSFVASSDRYVLQQGAPHFEVEGQFSGTRRSELRVRLAYVPGEGKRVFVNGAPLERLSEIVGMLPVVSFSPDDQALTAEGPDERRRFLDNIISQAKAAYLEDRIQYRRTMKQRNELLSQIGRSSSPANARVLASWDAELVRLGSRVIHMRHQFLLDFATFLAEAYGRIEDVAERPTITYDTIVPLSPDTTRADIEQAYRDELDRVADNERRRGLTLIGPHRDELVFELNGLEVRRYASQGQHRTFGMALKLAKYFYLYERLDEAPLFLLDDVFDPLDPERSEAFLTLLESDAIGQSFVTATHPKRFAEMVSLDAPDHRVIQVEAGQVVTPAAAS